MPLICRHLNNLRADFIVKTNRVVVNGEPALTSVRETPPHAPQAHPTRSSAGTGQLRSAGRTVVVRRGRHSAGNVTGWTLTDFIALPTRANVMLLYDGEANAQGFLGLRKL